MKKYELIINYDLLDDFCKINDFVIVTDEMLNKNNMYKDIVYATTNNFLNHQVYPKNMPIIMNKVVWDKLIRINNDLKTKGFCLKIYDAYRPIGVQKIFWEYFYNEHGYYDENLVANPSKYGTHNIKINAVDVVLVKLNGDSIPLPCEFDDFSGKASINYNKITEEMRYNRNLLISTFEKYGMIVNKDEWWHFFDERVKDYGMGYNYINTVLIPKNEEDVFKLIEK